MSPTNPHFVLVEGKLIMGNDGRHTMNATKKMSSAAASDVEIVATFAMMLTRMSLGDNNGTMHYNDSLENMGFIVVPTNRRCRQSLERARARRDAMATSS
jgi:hypothetical protein